jgi:peptide/nickel transport system substrate-binding protein
MPPRVAIKHTADAYVVAKKEPDRLDRREFVAGVGMLGALAGIGGGLALSGCAVSDDSAPASGNMLRLGMVGGTASDTLDPRTFLDMVPVNIGYQIMNGLVEIDADGKAVPELLASWEPNADAREWVFDVRGDIVFHNGKTLDADDIIYSINLHRGNTTSAARGVVGNIRDLKKLDSRRVQILLEGGDSDLPSTLSDYHLMVVPDGFADWANPIGTGGYRLERFEPGVRCVTIKAGSYWKPDAGHVDAIELLVINDPMARINALISGQVDAINRIDGRTADLLRRSKALRVVRSQTGQHAILAMNCTIDPYTDNDVRLALKYAIDRERIVKTVLNGYGEVGDDQPIVRGNPYYNASLPQHTYDPDKARYYLKRARRDRLDVELKVSEVAFAGAVDAGVLYQAAAADAGININVKREPSDGYWSNVWSKAPFCASYSDGRATVDGILSKGYKSTSAINDTSWRRPEFDRIANAARGTLDQARRRELFGECQRMICEEGGAIIPMFIDHIEAGSTRVMGWKPSGIYDFMGQRIGEKVWLPS